MLGTLHPSYLFFFTNYHCNFNYLRALMKFVYPEILWALAALAIPILVHLFNFRRFKKVAFPNVAFLKEVKQETQSKSKVKHLLILLTRMLALAAIVLAFAQPYLPLTNSEASTGDKAVSIYIDNSFSMEAENADGRLLDLAKNKALEIVDYYRPSDRFQLLTNDFEGRHQRLVNKEEITEMIEEIDISPRVVSVEEAYIRQKDVLVNSDLSSKTAYMLTDLQQNTHDFSNLNADTTIAIRLVPTISESASNLFIDSVWFATPVRTINQPEELKIRIRNSGSENLQSIPLRLSINGAQRALGAFDIESDSYTDTALFFSHAEGGIQQGILSIEDHPVVFDNSYFLSYEVAEQINILEVTRNGTNSTSIARIFQGDDFYSFESHSSGSLDYGLIPASNLIILNGLASITSGLASEIQKHLQNGGVAWLIPSNDGDVDSYNELIQSVGASPMSLGVPAETKVSEINLEHPLYQGIFESIPSNIDLPVINYYYPSQRASRSGEVQLLGLQNGASLLSEYKKEEGRLFVQFASLDPAQTNLTQHAVFVATAIRIAEFSQTSSQIAYTIGEDNMVSMRNLPEPGESAYHITSSVSGLDFLPSHRRVGGNTEIFLHNQLTEAGNLNLELNNESLGSLAFNFSRKESDTRSYGTEEIKELLSQAGLNNAALIDSSLESIGKYVGELDEGKKLWHGLIIFALICLALEILLIKFWK